MIKFWTLQNKYTLEKIIQDGIYYPDFNYKGELVSEDVNLSYDIIRRIYESKNNLKDVKGLVFGLTNYLNRNIDNYEYYKYIIEDSKTSGISYCHDDYYILELEIDENLFDMCSCHFYNFTDLIYYFDIDYKHVSNEERMLALKNLFSDDSYMHLIQSHIHYIDKSMIKGIYKSYDYVIKIDSYQYGECRDLDYYRYKLIETNK